MLFRSDHLNYNTFTHNVAGRNGGGLFTDDTGHTNGSSNDYDAVISGNTFFKNAATAAGGGLAQSYQSSCTPPDPIGNCFPMSVTKNVFRQNSARVGGGAAIDFHSKRSKTAKFLKSMRKNRFIGNRAKSSGNPAVGVFTWDD